MQAPRPPPPASIIKNLPEVLIHFLTCDMTNPRGVLNYVSTNPEVWRQENRHLQSLVKAYIQKAEDEQALRIFSLYTLMVTVEVNKLTQLEAEGYIRDLANNRAQLDQSLEDIRVRFNKMASTTREGSTKMHLAGGNIAVPRQTDPTPVLPPRSSEYSKMTTSIAQMRLNAGAPPFEPSGSGTQSTTFNVPGHQIVNSSQPDSLITHMPISVPSVPVVGTMNPNVPGYSSRYTDPLEQLTMNNSPFRDENPIGQPQSSSRFRASTMRSRRGQNTLGVTLRQLSLCGEEPAIRATAQNDPMRKPANQPLDKTYRLRKDKEYGTFFRPGRVLAMLYHTNYGHDTKTPPHDSTAFELDPALYTTETSKGELIHSHIRRFIIFRARRGYCLVVPINSYGTRGLTKDGGKDWECHAIAYQQGTTPRYIRGEPDFTKEAICIQMAEGERLKYSSRIHFGRITTIDCNIKVKDIGMLATESDHANVESYVRKELLRR